MTEYERGRKEGLLAFAAFAETVAQEFREAYEGRKVERDTTTSEVSHVALGLRVREARVKQVCWEVAAGEARLRAESLV